MVMDARPMKYGKSANLTVLRAGICPSAKKPSSAVYALTASSEFFHSQAGCEGCCLQCSACQESHGQQHCLSILLVPDRYLKSGMLLCALPYLMLSSLLLSLRLLMESCFCEAPAGACTFSACSCAVWVKHQIATASCLLHRCHL